jgi:hypothetical protein
MEQPIPLEQEVGATAEVAQIDPAEVAQIVERVGRAGRYLAADVEREAVLALGHYRDARLRQFVPLLAEHDVRRSLQSALSARWPDGSR